MAKLVTRSIASAQRQVYLTFDDGPDPFSTPRVLDVLAEFQAHATFFLIAEKASAQPQLVQRILQAGHSIGNHSLDHRYGIFFQGSAALKNWIEQSEREFVAMGLPERVGFRPPAGVVTPPLHRALRELNEPLVLWNERFYDTVIPWSAARARRSAVRLREGSIVLLHDRQREKRIDSFCVVLAEYLQSLAARGLQMAPLTRHLVERNSLLSL